MASPALVPRRVERYRRLRANCRLTGFLKAAGPRRTPQRIRVMRELERAREIPITPLPFAKAI